MSQFTSSWSTPSWGRCYRMIIRGIAISSRQSAISKGIAIGNQEKMETSPSLLIAALGDSH